MNATKNTPPPAEAPVDPTRKPFRRYLAICALVIVVSTVGRASTTLSLLGHTSELDVWGRAGIGLLVGISAVAAGTLLLSVFAPARARRIGLPAGAGGDERERHIVSHGYSAGYLVGIIATAVYSGLFDNIPVLGISISMQAAYFISVVTLNRKV